MSPGQKLTVLSILALLCAWACEPDLDSLHAGYQGGTAGVAVSGGSSNAGMGGTGGDIGAGGDLGAGGTGGDIGAGGDTGGVGGTGAVGGGGTTHTEAGMAGEGDSGAPPVPTDCDNLERDVNESDVDCGGSSTCPRCASNLRCSGNNDCSSGFCKGTRCAEPTCADGYKNQDETGTDCGGSCAPELGCDIDVACTVNEDCTSEFCKDEVCSDHCQSEKREANETDKDCGGPDCEPCADTLQCEKGADCVSRICFNNACQAATCDDNVQNQDESDEDCGGICVTEDKYCPVDALCNGPADCDSYVCPADRCVADLDIAADDAIDTFEDGDLLLSAGDRVGNWYPFGDGTGTVSVAISAVDRGPYSTRTLQTTGTNFTSWGSGVGVDMYNPGGSQATKEPYDASAFTGVTFWARAAIAVTVTVVFPDRHTDAAGMFCTTCDHHYFKPVSVGTTWERFIIPFSTLVLETGGVPLPPDGFDASGLVAVQFRMASGISYELWIDDVAFVR